MLYAIFFEYLQRASARHHRGKIKNYTPSGKNKVTSYTHAHQVPHAEHMESSKYWRDDAALSSAYPFTSQRAK